jgi:hypothetical protein
MKVALIHVGTHKTGTTSLQVALSSNRTHLLEQGVLYPVSGSHPDWPGHHNLAFGLVGRDGFDPDYGGVDEVCSEIAGSGAERVVLSAEDLVCLAAEPSLLEDLRRRMEVLGFEVHVLLVLREIESYRQSLFAELWKRDPRRLTRASFDEAIARDGSFEWNGVRYPIDFAELVEVLAGVFGLSRLHVREYQTGSMVEELMSDFAWFFGGALSVEVEEPRENSRTELLEDYERKLAELHGSVSWRFTRPLRSLSSRIRSGRRAVPMAQRRQIR